MLPPPAQSSVYRDSSSSIYAGRMALSKNAIDEFKAICRDEFGVELSDVEAEQRAREVLDFFWLLSSTEHHKELSIDEI